MTTDPPWAGNRPSPDRNPRKKRIEADTSEADAIAEEFKSAYMSERTRFESRCAGVDRVYYPSSKWDGEDAFDDNPELTPRESTWRRVASKLRELEIDPVDCVVRIFADLMPGESPLQPNQMASKDVVARYYSLSSITVEEIEAALKAQAEIATAEFRWGHSSGPSSKQDLWVDILLDEALSLSALFRYCLASDLANEVNGSGGRDRFLKVAGYYEPQATSQYRRNHDAYDEVWHEILPDEFRERALAG